MKAEGEESDEEEIQAVDTVFFNPDSYTVKHPLENQWAFWFDNPAAYGRKGQANWADNLVKVLFFFWFFCCFRNTYFGKIYTIKYVEDFWAVYNNLVPAAEIAEGGNYHFFKVL